MEHFSNELFSPSSVEEHSENETSENNIFNRTEIENYIIVNTRNNDSSTDSLKLKLDDIVYNR